MEAALTLFACGYFMGLIAFFAYDTCEGIISHESFRHFVWPVIYSLIAIRICFIAIMYEMKKIKELT